MKKNFGILVLFMLLFSFVSCIGVDGADKKDDQDQDADDENNGISDTPGIPSVVDGPFDFGGIVIGEVTLSEEDAFTAVKNMKSGVNLFNTFDATSYKEGGPAGWIANMGSTSPSTWETAWGQPVITKKLIQDIKAQGFNAIRVPVTWAEHIEKNDKINKAWMARVKEVVGWVLEEDLYCLLNTHHDGGTDGWVKASTKYYDKYKKRYASVYTQIANEFKDFGEKLVLCGTNEMIADGNWGNGSDDAIEAVNKWNQLFVYTVRATGGNNAKRNLMVGTYCCSANDGNLKGFKRPDDIESDMNHLIMEIHCYSPQDFTWETAGWLPNWTTEWKPYMESALDGEFSRIKQYADKNNMPVILGEWGTLSRRFPGKDDKGNPKWEATTDEEGAKFTEYFITKSREKGFCSFYWDTSELIDRNTGKVKSPLMIQGIMNGCK